MQLINLEEEKNDMLRDDSGYVYLFRGDIYLPKGVIPISRRFRTSLYMGHKFKDAMRLSISFAESTAMEMDELEQAIIYHTKLNSNDSPFVSATNRLQTALNYSTDFGKATREGYISMIRVHPLRFVKYQRLVEYNELVQRDFECAIKGCIKPEEYICQIPSNVVVEQLKERGLNDKANLFLELHDLLFDPAYSFKQQSIYDLTCPFCKGKLYRYLSDSLGNSNKNLKRVKTRKLDIGRDTLRIQYCKDGVITQCHKCRSFLYNTEILDYSPLIIEGYWNENDLFYIKWRNNSGKTIIAATIYIYFSKEGKEYERSFQFHYKDFGTTDVGLNNLKSNHPMAKTFFDMFPEVKRRLKEVEGEVGFDYHFDYGVERTEEMKEPDFIESKVEGIFIQWIHFNNGSTWQNIDPIKKGLV